MSGKSGNSPGHRKTRKLYPLDGKECERCGAEAQLRHHKDENPENTAASNIEFLCYACHASHHSSVHLIGNSNHLGHKDSEETRLRKSEAHDGRPRNMKWLKTASRDSNGRFTSG